MSENKRIHAVVHGRVQGVGFRYFTQRLAQSMNIVGEVKNRGNGDVELIAEAVESDLRTFLHRVEKGPALSRVVSGDVEWLEAHHQHDSFDITY